MATHKFITCDVCGKRFEYRNEKWAAILTAKKLKKFREIKLFYGNLSGYDYAEYSYELCGECTKKLDELLRGNQKTEIIRCKNCAKREYCRTSTVWAVRPRDDWFCADAERRTDAVDKC